MRITIRPLVAMLVLYGCATTGTGSDTAGTSTSASSATRSRDLITTEEIGKSGAQNAYDLITSLRPNWLNTRGEHSFRETARTQGRSEVVTPGLPMVVVYLDNARLGGVETLRQVLVPALTSIQYFDAKAATFKWGAGHSHGAILVSTTSPLPAVKK